MCLPASSARSNPNCGSLKSNARSANRLKISAPTTFTSGPSRSIAYARRKDIARFSKSLQSLPSVNGNKNLVASVDQRSFEHLCDSKLVLNRQNRDHFSLVRCGRREEFWTYRESGSAAPPRSG